MSIFEELGYSYGQLGLAGMHVYESQAATSLPDGKPYTDDMKAMVEHLSRVGEVRRRPAAFKTPNGSLVMHPILYESLKRGLASQIERQTRKVFFGD